MDRLRPPLRRLPAAALTLACAIFAGAMVLPACAPADFSEGILVALESDFDVDDSRYRLFYRLDGARGIAEQISIPLVQTCQSLGGPAQDFDGAPCIEGRSYRLFPATFGVGPDGKRGKVARGGIATFRFALYDANTREALVWKAVTFQLPEDGTKILRVPFAALDLGSAVVSPQAASAITIDDAGIVLQLACPDVVDARSIALDGARGSVAGTCTQAIASGDDLAILPAATAETSRNSGTCFDSVRCAQGAVPLPIALDQGDCVGTPPAPLAANGFNVFYRPDPTDPPIFQRKGTGGADAFLLRPFRASDGPLAYGWTLRADGKLLLPRALCGDAPNASTVHPSPFLAFVATACPTRPSEVPVCPGAGPR